MPFTNHAKTDLLSKTGTFPSALLKTLRLFGEQWVSIVPTLSGLHLLANEDTMVFADCNELAGIAPRIGSNTEISV